MIFGFFGSMAIAPMDWDAVQAHLSGCRVLVAAQNPALAQRIKAHDEITLLDLEADPKPIEDLISLALLKAVANEPPFYQMWKN